MLHKLPSTELHPALPHTLMANSDISLLKNPPITTQHVVLTPQIHSQTGNFRDIFHIYYSPSTFIQNISTKALHLLSTSFPNYSLTTSSLCMLAWPHLSL